MDLYVIRRRSNWDTPEDLELGAAKSTAEGENTSDCRSRVEASIKAGEAGLLNP